MIKAIVNNGVLKPIYSDNPLVEGRELLLNIEEDGRTNQQNKYLWKVFEIIAKHYTNEGNPISKNQVKARLLYKLGHADYYIAKEDGKLFGIVKETKDLSKKDFSELTEKILSFMSKEGLYIMTPEEYFSNLKINK